MKTTATCLLALLALPVTSQSATAAETTPAPGAPDRLAVSFFTTGFLADIGRRIEAARIERARLTDAYLQRQTGLLWARQDNGSDVDWYAADEYCQELEVADWTDWRMPTIAELERLHDRRSNASYKLPIEIRLTACCPWSRSRVGDSSAWNFSYRYRKRFSGSLNYSYGLRALCVRTASEADVLFYEEAAEELKKRSRGAG